MRFSKRLDSVSYAIREFFPIARQMEREGRKIFYLNVGDPLKFDFDTPEHIKEALNKAIGEGRNYYASSNGIYSLRKAICEKEAVNGVDISPDQVVITHGVSEAINFTFGALVNPGDEILVPGPTYPSYIGYSYFYGGKPVEYRCVEENGWQPDLEDLRRKVSDKTRIIVLINPNNPTGAVYDEKTVKQIVDFAGEHELTIVSDEIYDRIIFDGSIKPPASLSKDVVVVGLNGFSKVYLMTGWRLGYLYIYDPLNRYVNQLVENIIKQASLRLSANTPVQYAAVEALKGSQDHIREMVNKLRGRRDFIYKRIGETEGLDAAKPHGAFYIFPRVTAKGNWRNDRELALRLLREEGVFIVQGSGFGEESGSNHFRSVFLPPIDLLEEAFSKIEVFIKRNSHT